MENDTEGLEEGGFLKGDVVWDPGLLLARATRGRRGGSALVEPLCGVDFVSLRRAVVRVDSGELHVLAEVVATLPAQEALVARHAWLYRHSVACERRVSPCQAEWAVGRTLTSFEHFHPLAALQNDAGGLVTQDAVAAHDEGADAPRLPEVNVRSARP